MGNGKATLVAVLKLSMILICAGWISLWILKPTQLWTKKWKKAEDIARPTVFGYYGLNFVVYTFPVVALAIIGFVFLHLLSREPRSRQGRSSATALSNPLVVSTVVGILSSIEILLVSLFIIFLAWTFYARISNDFKKLMPIKSLKPWQLKYLRVATRFGLLAEACLALLLLPILRGLSIFRLLGIQFEASVRYHIWLGTAMIFFATVHGSSTLFVWGVSHNIQDWIFRWQKSGRINLAGEIALVTGLAIWITSLPQIRRTKFELFYYTHHLYMVFLVFFLFHGGDRHFYMVFGGVFLFGLDKLLRIIQSRPVTCILAARVFPSKAIELVLPKDPSLKYTPSSILFMKIPSISKYQWHSFSITSSSSVDDHTISLIVKCDGGWTGSLYQMLDAQVDSDAEQMRCIPIAIEGPYGPATMDFLRYDSLVLVAGGSGITPFLSILQEIASAQNSSSRYKFPNRIQLIYAVKSSQDVCLLNSISHLLLNRSHEKWHLKLKVFVTQEERSNVTLRELLNDTSLVRTVRFRTESNYAVYGVENSLWMAALIGIASIVFLVFLICLSHIFVPSEKKGGPSEKLVVPSEKKVPKEKTPSWVADLIILSSFIIAITTSTLVAIILRWRRLRKEIPPVSIKQEKAVETIGPVEEHEIHFGGRPNLEEIFSKFPNETGGSNIGVLACGPETMKESVASLCQQRLQCFWMSAKKKKPHYSFHSLNFTL